MAASTQYKSSEAVGMHLQQDSAVHLHLHDASPSAHPGPTRDNTSSDSEPLSRESEQDQGFSSDSGFDSGSLLGDETDSLASSILNHRMENGRQYHAYRDGSYWGPNDELAKEILDFAHHMYLLTLDQKLHLAPLQNPHTILDCGTGTGIWAIVRMLLDPWQHWLMIPGHG